MADGFKKYFNSSTMQGRANVAKVTYATFAIVYLIYRVRRGPSKPTNDEKLLADGKESGCNCDKERDPIDPSSGVYEADPECAVCRDRAEKAMTEFDKEEQRRFAKAQEEEDNCNSCGHSSPKPPSPPPSDGGATSSPPKRKCPCDASHHRSAEGPVKNSQTRARFQNSHFPPPVPSEVEQAHPVSEIIGQVHEAVYQAFRTVVTAVMGGASEFTDSNSHQTHSPREDCRRNSLKYANKTNCDAMTDANEDRERSTNFHQPTQQEDEEREEEVLLPRRTAPRSCVPTGLDNQEEKPQTDTDQSKLSESQLQPQPHKEHYHHSFSDGFAAEMYFENAEE